MWQLSNFYQKIQVKFIIPYNFFHIIDFSIYLNEYKLFKNVFSQIYLKNYYQYLQIKLTAFSYSKYHKLCILLIFTRYDE